MLALGHHVVAVDESPQVPEMLQGSSVREKDDRRFVISDVEHLPGNRQDLGPRQAHLSL
ncbi:hypothetical protein [Kribbella sp. CCNWLY201]|uniref:hypothetical protein n=1 Tax=unclassified Kribbella TaxID=2644121 RepID=UPI003FA6070A